MAVAKSRVKLSDQIRNTIRESDMSRYQIWKATGIDQGALSRFVAGKAGMSFVSLDRLADLLGLNIAIGRSKRR